MIDFKWNNQNNPWQITKVYRKWSLTKLLVQIIFVWNREILIWDNWSGDI